MAMEHDRMHQLALKSGYLQSRYLYKLMKEEKICDAELRNYTELLIDDIFQQMCDISREKGLVDNHTLHEKIKKLYLRE